LKTYQFDFNCRLLFVYTAHYFFILLIKVFMHVQLNLQRFKKPPVLQSLVVSNQLSRKLRRLTAVAYKTETSTLSWG